MPVEWGLHDRDNARGLPVAHNGLTRARMCNDTYVQYWTHNVTPEGSPTTGSLLDNILDLIDVDRKSSLVFAARHRGLTTGIHILIERCRSYVAARIIALDGLAFCTRNGATYPLNR